MKHARYGGRSEVSPLLGKGGDFDVLPVEELAGAGHG